MKIAFTASATDHSNPLKNTNLIGNYLVRHFKKADVEVQIFPVNENSFLKYFFKSKRAFFRYIRKQNHLRHREPKFLKQLSNQVSIDINKSDSDIVFAFGSLPVAYLEVDKPIYFLTDATFQNLHNFYDEYKNLSVTTIRNAEEIERLAFGKAKKIFFSSQWAADSAINDYGVSKDKIEIVPLGGNFESVPGIDQIEKCFDPRNLNQINLLSFGKYWFRKGHDRAIEVLERLLQLGVNAHLTIVGSSLPDNWNSYSAFITSKITVFDNLSKDVPAELEKLENILKKTHFLLLLSRSETYGHVICEANAFGVPVIANNIGGVSSAVRNGINGFLINETEIPEKAALIIEELASKQDLYKKLSYNSKIEYEKRLNWDNTIKMILDKIDYTNKS